MSQVIEDGTTAVVHYTGSFPDGEVFDSSDGKDKSSWEVEIPGSDVVFNTVKDLQCVIECLERNIV